MYAVELFFDGELDYYVRKMWKKLHEEAISSFMFEIDQLRPHITLAVYNEITDLFAFKTKLESHFINQKKIDINFPILGIFPATGTCFLAPTITNELMQTHSDFHRAFDEYKQLTNPYYLPNNWNPHCTLATHLEKDDTLKALDYCLKDFKPFKSQIAEIGVVEITFEGDKCVSSPTIIVKKL